MTEPVVGKEAESAGAPPVEPHSVDGPDVPVADETEEPANEEAPETDEADEGALPDPIAELSEAVARLTAESARYHERARHREAVIDNLHSEVETLRTGERRGTARPLLARVARVRNDLLRQAGRLPEDFDAAGAQRLLESFAVEIEIMLEDFAVATLAPSVGDEFDPRRHNAVSREPAPEAALVRRIAAVQREGYVDVETGISLSHAEVVVYVDAPASPDDSPAAAEPLSAPPLEEDTLEQAPTELDDSSQAGDDQQSEGAP